MSTVKHALDNFIARIKRLSFAESLRHFHREFRSLQSSGLVDPQRPWLHTFEIATIAKWVVLESNGGAANPDAWNSALNAHKALWRAIEEQSNYPDNERFRAAFVLRFAYQQLPWNLTSQRAAGNWIRTRALFAGSTGPSSALRRKFESAIDVDFDQFMRVAEELSKLFGIECEISLSRLNRACFSLANGETVNKILGALSAKRSEIRIYRRTFASPSTNGIVYELNPLLRFPIVRRGEQFWSLGSASVNYAATRGLFFLLNDIGDGFGAVFSEAFEHYVAEICRNALGEAAVLTEATERAFGWRGKNNDLTVLLGDTALLIECKNSALFSVSKRSANLEDLAADVRKNLANPQKRKGLFQLHDKIRAIRDDLLPEALRAKYESVKEFFPVLLLYDEITFANAPLALKNLVNQELEAGGVSNFEYQIWHVEELESLFQLTKREELSRTIREKFTDATAKGVDLSSYLCKKHSIQDLELNLFVPGGGSKAWQILRTLADANR